MTEPTDIDDLIEWAKSLGDPDFTLSVPGHAKTAFRKMADALESTAAELRQERERADYLDSVINREPDWLGTIADLNSDLTRAREAIEKAEDWVTAHYLDTSMGEKVMEILATYDQSN